MLYVGSQSIFFDGTCSCSIHLIISDWSYDIDLIKSPSIAYHILSAVEILFHRVSEQRLSPFTVRNLLNSIQNTF